MQKQDGKQTITKETELVLKRMIGINELPCPPGFRKWILRCGESRPYRYRVCRAYITIPEHGILKGGIWRTKNSVAIAAPRPVW